MNDLPVCGTTADSVVRNFRTTPANATVRRFRTVQAECDQHFAEAIDEFKQIEGEVKRNKPGSKKKGGAR
jgi:hypothetical protein